MTGTTHRRIESPDNSASVPEGGRKRLPGTRFTAPHPAALVAAAVTALAFLGYMRAAQGLWFFSDDWDFLLNRRLSGDAVSRLLAPHNEHWVTIPILIYRTLFALFGIGNYYIYMVPLLLAHCGVCALIWSLTRRRSASPWAAAAGVALVSICGGGAENLVSAFQIAFVGSVFFGLLAIRIVDVGTPSTRSTVATWLASCGGLMCSGVGVPMLVALLFAVRARSNWRNALVAVSVPGVVYLVWHEKYGAAGLKPDVTTTAQRLQIPQFVWAGLSSIWQVNLGINSAGVLVFGGMVLSAAIWGTRDALGRMALGFAATTVVMYTFTAWTRVELGLGQAAASRYIYVGTVLTVPLVVWGIDRLVALSRSNGTARAVTSSVVVLTIFTLVNMVGLANQMRLARIAAIGNFREQIEAVESVVESGAPILNTVPFPTTNPDISTAKLARRDVQRAFPATSVTDSERLDAQSHVQVVVSGVDRGIPRGASVLWPDGEKFTNSGCKTKLLTSAAFIDVKPGTQGGEVTISGPGSTVDTFLLRGSVATSISSWPVTPGVAAYVASSVDDATLRLTVRTAGPTTICLP